MSICLSCVWGRWCPQCPACTGGDAGNPLASCPPCFVSMLSPFCTSGSESAVGRVGVDPSCSAGASSCLGSVRVVLSNMPPVDVTATGSLATGAGTARVVVFFSTRSAGAAGSLAVGAVRRVVSQAGGALVLEVEPPPLATLGVLPLRVRVYPAGSAAAYVEATGTIQAFDRRVLFTCINCEGPAGGGVRLNVSLTNVLLPTGVPVGSLLTASFGGWPASDMILVSSSASLTVLDLVAPPVRLSTSLHH